MNKINNIKHSQTLNAYKKLSELIDLTYNLTGIYDQ